MPTETEILRERLQEYRALLEAAYIVITVDQVSDDSKQALLIKLEEHGIIEEKPNEP